MGPDMLHIHFGTGRLGLGLIAPFFKTPDSELFLLNRATSHGSATGSIALGPARRNELLLANSRKEYLIAKPGCEIGVGAGCQPRERVHYNGFFPFEDDHAADAIKTILAQSQQKAQGVIVTASVLTAENYAPVIDALNLICEAKAADPGSIGDVYLCACENMLSAQDVLDCQDLRSRIKETTRRETRCVPALVDRVCVEMKECSFEGEPVVLVHAEDYGVLKLELCPQTERLPELLRGSRIEFSRFLEVEKDIKSWLLNGSHWLIALTAFRETGGDANLKLNDFINGTENHRLYTEEVITEMRDGIVALLYSDPHYAGFVHAVDVHAYLDKAALCVMARFQANDDSIARILARFRAPTPDQLTTVESFVDRFLHRIEPPLLAYQAQKGVPAKSATQGVFNLFRLQASGIYVDTAHAHMQAA